MNVGGWRGAPVRRLGRALRVGFLNQVSLCLASRHHSNLPTRTTNLMGPAPTSIPQCCVRLGAPHGSQRYAHLTHPSQHKDKRLHSPVPYTPNRRHSCRLSALCARTLSLSSVFERHPRQSQQPSRQRLAARLGSAVPHATPAIDFGSGVPILYLACHGGMVTSSSADVGWSATIESKSALVAPILIATPKP